MHICTSNFGSHLIDKEGSCREREKAEDSRYYSTAKRWGRLLFSVVFIRGSMA